MLMCEKARDLAESQLHRQILSAHAIDWVGVPLVK